MQYWIRFWKGCVKLRITGGNVQRFINLCRMQGLNIWDICPENECTAWMDVESFFRLQNVIRKTKVKVHVLLRKGLPFLLFRNRHRKAFFAGIITAFLIVYGLSRYVWNIQVVGNYSYSSEEILKFLQSQDIKVGLLKEDLDCEVLEMQIRNTFTDITWVSVEMRGTLLNVHLKENSEKHISDENDMQAGDIVATKPALITSVVTRSGTSLVKAGCNVNAGDILVSGQYQLVNDSKEVVRTQYLVADAEVYGVVTYPYEYVLPMQYKKKKYIDSENNYAIRIGNNRWNLYDGERDENVDVFSEETQICLNESFYLPVYRSKNTYKTYEIIDEVYSKEEAEKISKEKLSYFLRNLEKNTIQILENNVTIEVNENICYSHGTITVIEEIGKLVSVNVPETEQIGE